MSEHKQASTQPTSLRSSDDPTAPTGNALGAITEDPAAAGTGGRGIGSASEGNPATFNGSDVGIKLEDGSAGLATDAAVGMGAAVGVDDEDNGGVSHLTASSACADSGEIERFYLQQQRVAGEPAVIDRTIGSANTCVQDQRPSKAASLRKVEVDLLSPNAAPPSGPKARDVIFGDGADGHRANLLLHDLISMHRMVWEFSREGLPKEGEEIDVLTERLFQLMKKGKGRDLAGMKDVPRSFLVGSGRFMQRDGTDWKELSDSEAKRLMSGIILTRMHRGAGDNEGSALRELGKEFYEVVTSQETEQKECKEPQPRPSDVLLLQRNDSSSDRPFNNQSGNKAFFLLASKHVGAEDASPSKRVEAALSVFLSKSPGTAGDNAVSCGASEDDKPSVGRELRRFILSKTGDDGQKTFSIVNPVDAVEVTLLFVFEVWLEKEAAAQRDPLGINTSDALHDEPKPSTEPIETPSAHDVLFGRGGMTNSHPGNKRFRDVIALHRPDYVKAIKNDKPNVARRIVRAIRTASPPGRFLKKNDDGLWYDVGNRIAAEKASQALREKSNAEKRQRSAEREAMRGKREGSSNSSAPAKRSKACEATGTVSIASPLLADQLNYVGAHASQATGPHLSGAPKGIAKVVKADLNKDELKTEGLPPNAVDKDGNILVTDWDILAGRGGLTNHHRGNKRFRDIVALHRPDYIRAPKVQKPSVARVIVRAIRNGDPPGRFLKKDEKTGKWYDIGDKKAAEKTSQALREKGNDRDRGLTSPAVIGNAKPPSFLLPAPVEATAEANSGISGSSSQGGPASAVRESRTTTSSAELRVDGQPPVAPPGNAPSGSDCVFAIREFAATSRAVADSDLQTGLGTTHTIATVPDAAPEQGEAVTDGTHVYVRGHAVSEVPVRTVAAGEAATIVAITEGSTKSVASTTRGAANEGEEDEAVTV